MVPTIVILGYTLIALLGFILIPVRDVNDNLRRHMRIAACAAPIAVTGAMISWMLFDSHGTQLTCGTMFVQFGGFCYMAFLAITKALICRDFLHRQPHHRPKFTLLQGGLR